MDSSTGLGHIAGLRSGDGHDGGGVGSNHSGGNGSGNHRWSRLDEHGSGWGQGQGNGSGNRRCLDGHRTGDGGSTDHQTMGGGQERHHRAVDTPGQSEQDYDNGELKIRILI